MFPEFLNDQNKTGWHMSTDLKDHIWPAQEGTLNRLDHKAWKSQEESVRENANVQECRHARDLKRLFLKCMQSTQKLWVKSYLIMNKVNKQMMRIEAKAVSLFRKLSNLKSFFYRQKIVFADSLQKCWVCSDKSSNCRLQIAKTIWRFDLNNPKLSNCRCDLDPANRFCKSSNCFLIWHVEYKLDNNSLKYTTIHQRKHLLRRWSDSAGLNLAW